MCLKIMLFYNCEMPNASVVDINTMRDIVMKRYAFYTNESGDYDTQTEFDVLGHFVMCLMANKSDYLYDIIMEGEKKIFYEKLNKIEVNGIQKELSCALKFVNFIVKIRNSLSIETRLKDDGSLIGNILKMMQYEAKHVFNRNHRNDCYKFEMILPFTFPLSLVANKEVEIFKGKAKVPCGKWKLVLIQVFQHMLEFEIKYFKELGLFQYVAHETEDDRLRNIIRSCLKNMQGIKSYQEDTLTANEVDIKSQYFPPCMLNLHNILRQTHRLSYDSRYQYTLFLKEIGLPVKENVLFWKNEYTKPYVGSSCTHHWEDKNFKYEYQIHHMYGLKGIGIQKHSHLCQKFIYNLTLRMNGGCPFVHMSKDSLFESLMKDLSEKDVEDILNHKRMNRPQKACAVYLQSRNSVNDIKRKMTDILSPVNYYHLAREMINCGCDKKENV